MIVVYLELDSRPTLPLNCLRAFLLTFRLTCSLAVLSTFLFDAFIERKEEEKQSMSGLLLKI